jgi:SSS family solute:Na+ symporter
MANISGVLYEYLQSVQSYIAPPITAVFLLGIFYKRINSQGALATLGVGLLVAFIRLTLELSRNSFDTDSIFYLFGNLNFLTFAAWFFLFSVVLCIIVSLLTPAPSELQIKGLTFGSLTEAQKTENRNSYNVWDIVFSVFVIGIVIFVMISFNG